MNKVMVTVVLDEDIYDELCWYPDDQVIFLSDDAEYVKVQGDKILKPVTCQRCKKDFGVDVKSNMYKEYGDATYIVHDTPLKLCKQCAAYYYAHYDHRRLHSCYSLEEVTSDGQA